MPSDETPKPYPVVKCQACKNDVIWTVSQLSGKQVAVDAKPTPDGTIRIEYDWNQQVVSRVVSVKFRFGRKDLRVRHGCLNRSYRKRV